ncbi:DinB family protein [Danxiaibacter flavus]|uniref:DinB family protein n=1 Tax=Danxiaibacter flavus TaxID=3049108 RepID=A0ABV3ZFE5_9BACT|nr:DinB family protein [Chitinophagaceae bacterium DXS]
MANEQYEGPAYSSLLYFIDNEIHHRAQGYVYLRSLGIQPPFFWDREF